MTPLQSLFRLPEICSMNNASGSLTLVWFHAVLVDAQAVGMPVCFSFNILISRNNVQTYSPVCVSELQKATCPLKSIKIRAGKMLEACEIQTAGGEVADDYEVGRARLLPIH